MTTRIKLVDGTTLYTDDATLHKQSGLLKPVIQVDVARKTDADGYSKDFNPPVPFDIPTTSIIYVRRNTP